MNTDSLRRFLEEQLGDSQRLTVEPMVGGGSCDVFSVVRGGHRWVLRRAPEHTSSATAHNVLREFAILDAIKDERVRIARPLLACDDPAVFGAPFYLMDHVDGVPVRSTIPDAWSHDPAHQGGALEQLTDELVAIHGVDWRTCGLTSRHEPGDYLHRQIDRWLAQLTSYGGRDLALAHDTAAWLDAQRPPEQALTLCHGDYKLDNVLYAPTSPPHLLAVVDWEMSAIGDPLVDLAWALIFHPGPAGLMRLGALRDPAFVAEDLPTPDELVARYALGSGRDTEAFRWYEVFARWKLAIVLEGSYAKFLRGESDKPVHEKFGAQIEMLLTDAQRILQAER